MSNSSKDPYSIIRNGEGSCFLDQTIAYRETANAVNNVLFPLEVMTSGFFKVLNSILTGTY